MAIYQDGNGNQLVVTQKAGRRSLERLGYVLIEADLDSYDFDDEPEFRPITPGQSGLDGESQFGDVLSRGDISGTVETPAAPLGVNLEPDPEPEGVPAPWVNDLPATPDAPAPGAEPANAEPDVEPEKADEEPKPATVKRSPRRGSKPAAADD